MSSVTALTASAVIAAPSIAATSPIGDFSAPELAEKFARQFAKFKTFFEKREKIRSKAVEDDDPDLTEWDEISEEIFPLANDILNLQARTPADLLLQAQAAAVLNSEYWTSAASVSAYQCSTERTLRLLVDSVVACFGGAVLEGVKTVSLTEALRTEA